MIRRLVASSAFTTWKAMIDCLTSRIEKSNGLDELRICFTKRAKDDCDLDCSVLEALAPCCTKLSTLAIANTQSLTDDVREVALNMV